MSQGTNRRRENRSSVQGPVKIVVDSPFPTEITATLLDLSPNGFRAQHGCRDLQRGDHIRFLHKDATGSAVVIWSRILGSTIESGFLVNS